MLLPLTLRKRSLLKAALPVALGAFERACGSGRLALCDFCEKEQHVADKFDSYADAPAAPATRPFCHYPA